mmetsp:Transcript_16174/g.38698  ORF Transcript_16174/g.38698 Transcript_16174/m.38698 type:complete len:115 (-) Transcript_16174:361-705(-)
MAGRLTYSALSSPLSTLLSNTTSSNTLLNSSANTPDKQTDMQTDTQTHVHCKPPMLIGRLEKPKEVQICSRAKSFVVRREYLCILCHAESIPADIPHDSPDPSSHFCSHGRLFA